MTRLSVTVRCAVEIPRADSFFAYVGRRLTEDRGYGADDVAEHTRTVEQAMNMLFELDDWTTDYGRKGAEFGGATSEVCRIDDSSGAAPRLSLFARWDFYVHSPRTLLCHVRRRLTEEGPAVPGAATEHVMDSAAAMLALFELDGWSASYPDEVLTMSGREVKVRQVAATLEEGAGDECADPAP